MDNLHALAKRIGSQRITYRVLRYAEQKGYLTGENAVFYAALVAMGFIPSAAAELATSGQADGAASTEITIDGTMYQVKVSRSE